MNALKCGILLVSWKREKKKQHCISVKVPDRPLSEFVGTTSGKWDLFLHFKLCTVQACAAFTCWAQAFKDVFLCHRTAVCGQTPPFVFVGALMFWGRYRYHFLFSSMNVLGCFMYGRL